MKTKSGLQKKVSSIFDGPSSLSPETTPDTGSNFPQVSKRTLDAQSTNQLPANPEAITVQTDSATSESEKQKQPRKLPNWVKSYLPPFIAAAWAILLLVISAYLMGLFAQYDETASVLTKPVATEAPVQQTATVINWQKPAELPPEIREITTHSPAPGIAAGKTGKLIVKGILYSEGNSIAIVGRQFLKVGDSVADARVIGIKRKSVEFQSGTENWVQTVE